MLNLKKIQFNKRLKNSAIALPELVSVVPAVDSPEFPPSISGDVFSSASVNNANNIIQSADHLPAWLHKCKQRCYYHNKGREKLFGKNRTGKEFEQILHREEVELSLQAT